jgi:predicted NBD/HSP70 family sugar kinase
MVLKTIYTRDQVSRAEIARLTQLTRPTVSDVVAGLIADGLVEETGYAPSSGGRRAILLQVVDNSRCLIGLDLGRGDFRGATINLRGEIRHRVDLPLRGRDGDVALELVYDLVDAMVESADAPLLGIGIGAPGLVDAVDGVLHQSVNLNWRDVPLSHLLQERYNLPVYMANDCQAAALAEHTFGESEDNSSDLVVINAGWGIGAGIVLNGQLLHGNPLGAGEIGHVTVKDGGNQCSCGNYGCLETIVSSRTIVQRAQEIASGSNNSLLHRFAASPDAITLETICKALDAGDKEAQKMVDEIGWGLGIAASNLVGVLGSCRIQITGSVACFGQDLLDVVREELNKRALPSLANNTEIGFSNLGSDIVLLGASALLLSHELGVL